MKVVCKAATYATLLGLGACASIIEGSSQNVQIATNPASQASCSVANSRGSYNVLTPSQTVVRRSKTDLNIQCVDQASGYSGTKKVESELEPWFLGNVIFGGIIGAPIDFATGASWQYPKDITVALRPNAQPAAYMTPEMPVTAVDVPAPAPAAAPYYSATPSAEALPAAVIPPATAIVPAAAPVALPVTAPAAPTYAAPMEAPYATAPAAAPVTITPAAPIAYTAPAAAPAYAAPEAPTYAAPISAQPDATYYPPASVPFGGPTPVPTGQ